MAQLHTSLATSVIHALGTMRGIANHLDREHLFVTAQNLRIAANELESAAAEQDEIFALMLKKKEVA